jgi:aspartate/methionine/tyrosine aminotransferase
VLLASPSNPTGTSIHPAEMRRITQVVAQPRRHHAGRRDLPGPELRRHLRPQRAGAGRHDDIISINSFSKYFNMTGWRLGWLVVPRALVPD